jgi:hypothetical protein
MAPKYYSTDGKVFKRWMDYIKHEIELEREKEAETLREKKKIKCGITNAELIEILSKRPADEYFDINFEVEIWTDVGQVMYSAQDLEGEGLCYSVEEDEFYMFGGKYDVS